MRGAPGKSLYCGFHGKTWASQGGRLGIGCFEYLQWALGVEAVLRCWAPGPRGAGPGNTGPEGESPIQVVVGGNGLCIGWLAYELCVCRGVICHL